MISLHFPRLSYGRLFFVSSVNTFLFGTLLIVADEILGVGLQYGSRAVYYFPIIGPVPIWDAWVAVFTGIGSCFFTFAILVYRIARVGVSVRQDFVQGLPRPTEAFEPLNPAPTHTDAVRQRDEGEKPIAVKSAKPSPPTSDPPVIDLDKLEPPA